MTIDQRLMVFRDVPKSWRYNARTEHYQGGRWIKLNSCYEPQLLPCTCRKCSDPNGEMIEGVPVSGFYKDDHSFCGSDALIERGFVGLYVRDEMVEIELCEGECLVDCEECDLFEDCYIHSIGKSSQ